MDGYRKKPILIEIFALLYLLNPIGNILLVIFMNSNYTPGENILRIWNFIAIGNIVVILNVIFWISAVPLSIGLYKVRLWAWYYFLFHSIGMIILNFFGNDGSVRVSFAPLINLVLLIPIGFFISKEIRTPYFNPRLRWWEQSSRFFHKVKMKIVNKQFYTYDISETGAFIMDEGQADVEVGELIPLIILTDSFKINCYAEVIWINPRQEKYPVGVGIKYYKLKIKDKLILRSFIKELKVKGQKEAR